MKFIIRKKFKSDDGKCILKLVVGHGRIDICHRIPDPFIWGQYLANPDPVANITT